MINHLYGMVITSAARAENMVIIPQVSHTSDLTKTADAYTIAMLPNFLRADIHSYRVKDNPKGQYTQI